MCFEGREYGIPFSKSNNVMLDVEVIGKKEFDDVVREVIKRGMGRFGYGLRSCDGAW